MYIRKCKFPSDISPLITTVIIYSAKINMQRCEYDYSLPCCTDEKWRGVYEEEVILSPCSRSLQSQSEGIGCINTERLIVLL